MDSNFDENILKENISKLLEEKFGNYSKYIILDRALPDMRDGLKPVQRRIFYAMKVLRLFSSSQYKKSARIVGEVIGKYHPHGDSSVYEAMVRLSQNWKMRYPLISMHGNNGSIDGDPAAAMRYTEVRLATITNLLLKGIDKETVDFIPNFDDNEIEPIVLPTIIPNLLMNGAIGIASGYATNIPPHNLNELIDAIVCFINNSNSKLFTIKNLREHIKAPDFPTGGTIIGSKGLDDIYNHGKGSIVIEAKYEVNPKQNKIIITEIPFEANKSEIIKQIDNLALTNLSLGIKKVEDMTSKNGLKIEIKISSTIEDIDVVMNNLFKYTDLRKNYSANMVAIINNKPIQFNLLDYVSNFVNFQITTYTKKYEYDLKQFQKKLEVVNALLVVVSKIDLVIKMIRKSNNKNDAIEKIKNHFNFNINQAQAIVNLRLYRLSNTDVSSLKESEEELTKNIEEITKILNNKNLLNKEIINNLNQIKSEFSSKRRTQISRKTIDDAKVSADQLITTRKIGLSLTHHGYVKTFPLKSSNQLDIQSFGRKETDLPRAIIETINTNKLFILTSKGRYVLVPIFKIKEYQWKQIGDHINTVTNISDNEDIIWVGVIDNFDFEAEMMFVTKLGKIKRVKVQDFETNSLGRALKAIGLKNNDELVSVAIIQSNKSNVIIITHKGNYLKYSISNVPTLSISAAGVSAIKLEANDFIAGALVSNHETSDFVITITNDGHIRRVQSQNLKSILSRASKGRTFLKTTPTRFISYTFLLVGHKQQINVLDNNKKWFVFRTSEIKNYEPGAISKKTIKNEVALATKNSYIDFTTFKKMKTKKEENFEESFDKEIIETNDLNIEKVEIVDNNDKVEDDNTNETTIELSTNEITMNENINKEINSNEVEQQEKKEKLEEEEEEEYITQKFNLEDL